jgi:hypothetical protein
MQKIETIHLKETNRINALLFYRTLYIGYNRLNHGGAENTYRGRRKKNCGYP